MTTSAPETSERLITGSELAAMGNIGRCELVEGRIIPMSPTGSEGMHGFVEAALGAALLDYVRRCKIGRVGVGEVGVYTRRNPDTVRGMDVFFISNERYAQRTSRSFLDVAPELIAEVLSPEDSWSGVMQKIREYFEIGARLVWIVDPQARRVYAYRSMTDVREFTDVDELPGDDVLPGFSVPVAALFE
ncbi:MAG: Uma2 family endonuclease [Roseiflexus sp.]|nr:Uma2 family endonuclease [Roseiflexus sp.]